MRLSAGTFARLGASWDGRGTNFALFSANAERVELCLFDSWGRREIRPAIPWEDTIIYEAHVKGLTQTRQDVPPNLRGTYGGLSSPAMLEHLKRLGVTTIELLPIHGLIDDRVLVERKLSNFW